MAERLKVLEMVKDGKVSPQQAVELLNAIQGGSGSGPSIVDTFLEIHNDQAPPRRLRIATTSDKGTTSYEIPLGIIKFFNGLFPNRFKLNVNNKLLEREHVMDRIYSGIPGEIYRETNEKGGEVVVELV